MLLSWHICVVPKGTLKALLHNKRKRDPRSCALPHEPKEGSVPVICFALLASVMSLFLFFFFSSVAHIFLLMPCLYAIFYLLCFSHSVLISTLANVLIFLLQDADSECWKVFVFGRVCSATCFHCSSWSHYFLGPFGSKNSRNSCLRISKCLNLSEILM